MEKRLVIDGNAVYEVDIACLRKKEKEKSENHKGEKEKPQWKNQRAE